MLRYSLALVHAGTRPARGLFSSGRDCGRMARHSRERGRAGLSNGMHGTPPRFVRPDVPRTLSRRCAPKSTSLDCEVEGTLPSDLNGTFYRVGPDFQYPPREPNIPLDGEGHIGMFRFENGHVDYKSRFVRTQRYKAQAAARESLFGTYRNPRGDDPRVKGLSRGTANTTPMFHHGKLLALKEDSPPVVLDPDTLETVDDYYTFGGKLKSLTFTAHPKIDSESGELLAFGYEASGEGSTDVAVLTIAPDGRLTDETWIKVPYAGMIHDFAVTQKHVAFLVTPMITDVEGMKQGRIHFSWDSSLPTWLGVMRRGGDGKDLRWFKGPERCATHTTGCFTDGERVYVDMDMALKNQFPFIPQKDGSPYDPGGGAGAHHAVVGGPRARVAAGLRDGSALSQQRRALAAGRSLSHRPVLGGFHALPRCHAAAGPAARGFTVSRLQRLDALRSRAAPHAVLRRRRRFGRAGMLLRAALRARARRRWLSDRRRRP